MDKLISEANHCLLVTGSRTVVEAVKFAKNVAEAIEDYCTNKETKAV